MGTVDGRELAAFILAGGKSSRMGTDKAFLTRNGLSLLGHALEAARSVSEEVRIVGKKEKFAPYGPVVEDVFPDRGPLGGIHSALLSSEADLNLMLAVDMPFVLPPFLRYLAAIARATEAIVTIPRSQGRLQPLCAIYRREFAVTAEAALSAGRNKIDPLFATVRARIIEAEEWEPAGFSPNIFRNLNTPQDFHELDPSEERMPSS
jgi:molybdopterin-guanine dinucleotide biosynthesis protein A